MHSNQPIDGLADLARASEKKRDAALLRATTELFVLDVIHDRDELHRYEELASHFLPKASTEDRFYVAERLAICGDAPQAIVRMLARDVIEVAAPIIKHSSVLTPVDLLGVIAATGTEHHRLIARRSTLSADIIRALRLTGDAEVVSRLDNGGALRSKLTETAIDRSAATRTTGLYQSNRLDPWRFLALDRPARLRLIAEIASRPPSAAYSTNAVKLDRAFRSILSAAQIVGYARSGQLGAIIAAMADGLGLAPELIAAGVNDKSGELFAVMLKALRLDDVQAQQVFLLASPSGREVQSFFPLSDLYSGMEPTVAETLIEAWRDSATMGKPIYEPHLAENGERRHGAAVETPRQTTQLPDEQSKRA
jgi:uncharacterized protein (DUF2336 family)